MNNPDELRMDLGEGEREWLVTNGIGGYASGTLSGRLVRRFHGWLVAAHGAPLGRVMMLHKLGEIVGWGDHRVRLSAPSGQDPSPIGTLPIATLEAFRLEDGLPVWTYALGGCRLERRIVMPHGLNASYLIYRAPEATGPVDLELEPWLNFRPHGSAVDVRPERPYTLSITGPRFEVDGGGALPPLRLRVIGSSATFTIENDRAKHVRYPLESARGYDASGELFSVGFFRVTLQPGETACLLATTEPWEAVELLTPEHAVAAERSRRGRLLRAAVEKDGRARDLVLAADQFVITPVGRVADSARARASGDDVRTIIAGYPWFTDWGRDTMISLEGLLLVTGRFEEAGCILRTFARFVRRGLIPNLFPEGKADGLYHTADASLWFFHAVDRYLAYTGDLPTLEALLPVLLAIARAHEEGTDFGIGLDPSDGLLRQGAAELPLTWMDAKVGSLVVTPRRGKAVEINALYYNALRLLAGWTRAQRPELSRHLATTADRLLGAFNARFWNATAGYLYDVVDREGGGEDPAFRPNQLLAISLPHPVLARERWPSVIAQVEEKLLTPVGLRSLAADDPDYRPKYFGDLRARDLAYHQGTVWAWLIGPFIDAWLRVHPGEEGAARRFLAGFDDAMQSGCVGTVAEIFDATEPFYGRGCFAQAWSVAEVLRCQARLAGRTPREDPDRAG